MTRRYPTPVGSHGRFSGLLAATAIGVYLLVVVGATTTLTDAAASCPTWPACNGQFLPSFSEPLLVVAWAHRVVALAVAALVVASAAVAWLGDATVRVRALLAVAAVTYIVQVGVGAVAATSGTPTTLSAIHLVLGVFIFGLVMLALSWTLETETATDEDWEAMDEPEPVEVDEGDRPPVPSAFVPRAKATVLAYARMTKPRLMWLLCLVAAAGMALGSTVGEALTVETVLLTLGGGVLSIGSSGTFNHVLERDVDEKMERTADRPLASDLVPVSHALAFGVVLGLASLALFASVNLLVAVLGLTAIVFYSIVYTLVLKPNFVSNTVIGGAAGALPALIGWAAVTGGLGIPGVMLAVVIFLWTPAHFYNLALAYKEDYARGGFPMMPVVEGEAPTRKHILWYIAATLVSAGVLAVVADLGLLYALTSATLGGVFVYFAVQLHYEQTEAAAFRAFHASNAYLGALLLAVVVDALVL
ncbi:heme o synthase [Halorubellus salinus]|uniref:heme o synthase n=1 Tax=Halorubellus salinus TaxID=755309 RepID=UPI001D070D32